jgi:hypothetical protein
MIHFTCDLCGKDLTASGDQRFVVKIEAFPGYGPDALSSEDLDIDPMEAISELLQHDEGLSSEELADQAAKGFRYDLCPRCHAKFVKDPLGRDSLRTLDFSKN